MEEKIEGIMDPTLGIEERRSIKLLKSTFSGPERLQLADYLANAIRNLRRAEEDLASVSGQFKSEIKAYQAEIAKLAEKLNMGWEMKNIACKEILDYNNGSILIVREDTGEIVEERAMTGEERQMQLPGLTSGQQMFGEQLIIDPTLVVEEVVEEVK